MRAMPLVVLAVALSLAVVAPMAAADPLPPPEEGCDPNVPGLCVVPVTPTLCAIEGNPLCD